jgi:hypothetical protein
MKTFKAKKQLPKEQVAIIAESVVRDHGILTIQDELDHQALLGYRAQEDIRYTENELVRAATAYLLHTVDFPGMSTWPFHPESFKPGSRKRNLAKAGALIAAELNRINLLEEQGHAS